MAIKEDINGIRFKTKNENYYFYDNSSGMVFYCPNVMYEILRIFKTDSKDEIIKKLSRNCHSEEIQKYYKTIYKWNKIHGCFFFDKQVIGDDNLSEKLIKNLIFKHGFRQLILNVTEDCNLECKYCVYASGNYMYHRSPSKTRMSFEIAKQAVDYYIAGYKESKKMNPYKKGAISFYGGEPLMNFKLIKDIIEYINPCDKDIIFNLTTNGTLLTNEIVDFLVSNKVNITISLDGPEKEHDRNRVFKNGGGTFSTIMKNIKNLRKKYPKYQLLFSVCYDYKTNLIEVYRFFKENENLISPYLMRVSLISDVFTKYYDKFSEYDYKNFKKQLKMLQLEYYNKIIRGEDIPIFLRVMFDAPIRVIFSKPLIKDIHLPIIPYTGACMPGVKIAVNPDGTFHICEKMNEYFPIGDVTYGLDFKKIRDIISEYRKIILNCSKCSISRLCPGCYTIFSTNRFEKPPNFCEKTRESIRNRLSLVYSILEENPRAYEDLKSWSTWSKQLEDF